VSKGRPAPFFRGGELRGLVIFAALAVLGWVVVINTARPKAAPEAAPPIVATDPRPLQPDTSLAFQGLVDRTEMGPRDNTAYKTLLDRARETPPETLAKDARRDVFFTHLWERPDLYRGVPVHLEGTLRRVLPHEKVSEVFTPKGRLLEAWFFTPESQRLPYVVMVEDVPPGLPIGDNLNEPVTVDAYFLKLLRYQAGDTDRAAPLLVGRLRWKPQAMSKGLPAPAAGWKNGNAIVIGLVVGALAIYIAIRLLSQVRRVMGPLRRPASRGLDRPVEEIAPGDLADWLADVPDEDEPRDRP
jgi:hypothetical protein